MRAGCGVASSNNEGTSVTDGGGRVDEDPSRGMDCGKRDDDDDDVDGSDDDGSDDDDVDGSDDDDVDGSDVDGSDVDGSDDDDVDDSDDDDVNGSDVDGSDDDVDDDENTHSSRDIEGEEQGGTAVMDRFRDNVASLLVTSGALAMIGIFFALATVTVAISV